MAFALAGAPWAAAFGIVRGTLACVEESLHVALDFGVDPIQVMLNTRILHFESTAEQARLHCSGGPAH